MSAFLISRTIVKDPGKFQEYAAAAGPTIAAHGGRVVQRGAFVKALIGDKAAHATGILEFPDMAGAEAWFASPDYQALAPLRDEACDMELLAYQAPAS